MVRVLSGMYESDEPESPDPELAVRIIVPEEFAGWSMQEFSARRGIITNMEVEQGNSVIRGMLPTSEYLALVDVIATMIPRLGRIERMPEQ